MAEIISLGRMNLQRFAGKFGKILTDEVIITRERIEHIQTHHPEDFDLFELYGKHDFTFSVGKRRLQIEEFCYDVLENKGAQS